MIISLILVKVNQIVLRIIRKILILVQSEELFVVYFEYCFVVLFTDLTHDVDFLFELGLLTVEIAVKLKSVFKVVVLSTLESLWGRNKTTRLGARAKGLF